MKIRIEEATTCFACGIQTHYEVTKECEVSPQEFLNIKLAYLSKFNNCTSTPLGSWSVNPNNGCYTLIVYGKPMIKGQYQGCTSIWFTIEK